MADLEFFWDPVCPWAWITSRWVEEVADQRQLDVDWRFICLRILNEEKDYGKDFPPGYVEGHGSGLKLLRVAAAVREAKGREAMGDLYTQFGRALHVDRRRPEIVDNYEAGFPDFLRSCGLSDELAAAANEDRWDDVLRAETAEALSRTGKDVGTPILTFQPPDGPSFFGPVLSRVPRGPEALEIWDAVYRLATTPGMSELKRSVREKPITWS
jgi:2-hydroxychromene-2-carboxylate isomerase